VSGAVSAPERLRALGASATMGTDRYSSDEDAAGTLLTEAARFGIQARAGWRPRTHAARLPDCPCDDRPLAPRPALTTLAGLLVDPDPALIHEWAQIAIARGVLVDGATAPLVLDWWARQPQRSEAVFAVLGRRGEWLAWLNPDWQKHLAPPEVPANADDIWQTSRTPERIAILTSVRRLDPARALAMIESTWQSDGAADRQRFLDVLTEHRSMADEPFLEAALDDRSKGVRRQAANVLARIPGSRLRHRLSETARPFITIQTTRQMFVGRSRPKIVLAPPQSFDTSWERDGIEERPPEGVGPRAWWLRQILRVADFTVWTERTGLAPDTILAALEDDDYAADAVMGLVVAARASGDAEWSAALVRHLHGQPSVETRVLAGLLEALPDDRRESLSLEIATKSRLGPADRWAILTSFDRPWSEAFSTAVLKILGGETMSELDNWPLIRAIDVASRRVAPGALEAFEHAVTRALQSAPADSTARIIQRARLRADMHREFTS